MRISAINLALQANDDRSPFMEGLPDPQVHQALLDAREAGEIDAELHEGDGSEALWIDVRLNVYGLRALGLWPPAGYETVPGPWDRSVWATDALPLLGEIAEHVGEMYVSGPFGEGEESPHWRRWHAALLLAEAGLVQVSSREPSSMFIRGLSPAGEDALNPGSADPLDEADAAVAVGKLREAGVLAVAVLDEQILTPLATRHGVDRQKPNKQDKPLSALNDELRDVGAYGKDDHQQILAWLVRRNRLGHEVDHRVTVPQVSELIAGVRAFRVKTSQPHT